MSIKPEPRQVIFNPMTNLAAFGLGSGLAPFAPGTFGTLVAVPAYLFLAELSCTLYIMVGLIAFFVGVYFCNAAAESLRSHDHPAIVWDEIVGYWVAMAFVPVTAATVVTGFMFFRLFDITKPWPIRWIDKKVSGGIGIMLDDVIAGVYTNICLWFLHHYGIFDDISTAIYNSNSN